MFAPSWSDPTLPVMPRRSAGWRRGARWLRRALTAVGVGCLGAWSAVTVWSWHAALRNESLLERAITTNRHAAPVVAAPELGALLGRIDLPRTGVSAIVLEGTSARVLAQAAGHLRGTAYPGQGGNVAIAGHRDTVFRNLRQIRSGDVADLITAFGIRTYVVDSVQIVRPDDLSVLAQGGGDRLTLITCYPFSYVGRAPKRFVVRAVASDGGLKPITSQTFASLVRHTGPTRPPG